LSPFIKKYLKTAVVLVERAQVKGKGASGLFQLPAANTKKTTVSNAPVHTHRSSRLSGPKEKRQPAKTEPKTPKIASVEKMPVMKRSSPDKAKNLPSKAKKVVKEPMKKRKAPRPKTEGKAKTWEKKTPARAELFILPTASR
jgi:hypothetical protein